MSSRLPAGPALLGIGVVAPLFALLSTSAGDPRLASVLCVVAAGVLGLSVARWMERRGASRAACIATIAFSMVNPLTREALVLGHPEELLGGALCVGAVLAALRGRSARAALLLGLAAALAAPFVAGNLSLTDPLIVALGLPLSAAWWFSRRRTPDDALALLALLFLVRCLVDPVDNASYHVPFLLSLLAWEGLVRRRPAARVDPDLGHDPPFAIGTDLYLAAILPVATWLAVTLYLPRRIVARSPRASAGPLPATAGPSR